VSQRPGAGCLTHCVRVQADVGSHGSQEDHDQVQHVPAGLRMTRTAQGTCGLAPDRGTGTRAVARMAPHWTRLFLEAAVRDRESHNRKSVGSE
jgi:hypothetical protein